MKEIRIKIIPHERQRYSTCGDYWEKDGVLEVRISEMPDWRYPILVAIHEIIEYCACKIARVPMVAIDHFDEMFEEERKSGLHDPHEEPGMDCRAPYHKWHVWATRVERIIAWIWGVDWKKYSNAVNAL